MNLLANADKFAPEDSTVRIGGARPTKAGWPCGWRTRAPARLLRLPGKDSSRPSSRGAEQEPEPGGLGLGLWIVKLHRGAARRHGAVERTGNGADPVHADPCPALGGDSVKISGGGRRHAICVTLVGFTLTQAGYLIIKAPGWDGRHSGRSR